MTEFWNSNNKILNEGIIGLAILKMVVAGFQPLKILQIPVELLLITALLYACTTIKYDSGRMFLLLLLAFVAACSFVTSDIQTALVNGKQNGEAILSLLYFSQVRFRSRLIFPVFALTLLLLLINLVVPAVVAPLISLSSFEEYNESRFGGLFLNPHFNAYFMAVALIYYGYKINLFGIGILVMYLTGAKTPIIAYVANIVVTRTPIRMLVKYRTIILLCTVLGMVVFWHNASAIIEFFDSDGLRSAVTILNQLLDPAYYRPLLNPFPSGNIDVSGDAAVYSPYGAGVHSGYNEVGYFNLATVMGVFLAASYLFIFLQYARYYRVFILLSMLHVGFPMMEPFVTYMFLAYTKEIHTLVRSKVESRRLRQSVVSPLEST